jgi:hypothetical protein
LTTISCESILASHNVVGPKALQLHTVKARYPLWIHQELMTHRAFSRNLASSRAIPIEKMIHEAVNDPAMPVYWTKNEPGMQGYHFLEGKDKDDAIAIWLEARDDAVRHTKRLAVTGAHKQVANRLLGPYIHTTAVISSTQWSNFFGVRRHPATEPHMHDLADAIYEAVHTANVREIEPGGWHLPFVNEDDWITINGGGVVTPAQHMAMIHLSVGRCASVSYKTVEGFDMTYQRAEQLYSRLVGGVPIHASPAEHVAQADDGASWPKHDDSREFEWVWNHASDHRNFTGWRQHRATIPHDTL